MNYDDMSDYDINMSVIKIELQGQLIKYSEQESNELLDILGLDGRSSVVKFTTRLGSKQKFDGCNNPSDAWPIITKNHINLSKHKGDNEWFAFTRAEDFGVSELQCKDKNPLKAAMICFLKMKDAEK